MKSIGVLQGSNWESRPLCSRYLAVMLTPQEVVRDIAGVTGAQTTWWALGTVDDGQLEILGCWQHSLADCPPWAAIALDLKARGVEHIRLVFVSDQSEVDESLEEFFGGGSGLRRAKGSTGAEDLSPRLRRRVARSIAASRSLRKALARAVRRQDPANPAATAGSLFARELQRLDRRLWSHNAVPRSKRSQRGSLTRALG